KARWASGYHGRTLRLSWSAGEGFELATERIERDLPDEISTLLEDGKWRTTSEIGDAVGARRADVETALHDHADCFELRTGEQAKALGRSPRAQLYLSGSRGTSRDKSSRQGAHDATRPTRPTRKGDERTDVQAPAARELAPETR